MDMRTCAVRSRQQRDTRDRTNIQTIRPIYSGSISLKHLGIASDVWKIAPGLHPDDTHANGIVQCERHRRTAIVFTIFLPLAYPCKLVAS
jgi:hypothetical protein